MIHEFRIDPTVRGHAAEMFVVIDMLGFNEKHMGSLQFPIDWRDVADDGTVRPERMKLVEQIVAKLNSSNDPRAPHPATGEPLFPITTPELLTTEEEVRRDYEERARYDEEDNEWYEIQEGELLHN